MDDVVKDLARAMLPGLAALFRMKVEELIKEELDGIVKKATEDGIEMVAEAVKLNLTQTFEPSMGEHVFKLIVEDRRETY
jgi:hypothetical protein